MKYKNLFRCGSAELRRIFTVQICHGAAGAADFDLDDLTTCIADDIQFGVAVCMGRIGF